jgi:hypothetical protein
MTTNGAALSKIKKKLLPAIDGQDVTRLRTGTVVSVNANGSVNITLSGVLVSNVPRLNGEALAAGAVVQILSLRGSLLILGASSNGSARVEAFDSTNPTFTDTSFGTSGTVLGVVFIAPPSGQVEILLEGWLATFSTGLGVASLMTPQVREGNVINSGTIVSAPADQNAGMSLNDRASTFDYRFVTVVTSVTGLTPGASYNAVFMQKTAGTNAAVNRRRIIVTPI